MGLHVDQDNDFVPKESVILQETVNKAKRLLEYVRYALVITDCMHRKSELQGFRSSLETTELNILIRQLQSFKLITQNAVHRKWLLNHKHSVTYLTDLYTLISRQMGSLLVRPTTLCSRGYYHPSPSACQLSFRYGTKTYVFRGEDFESLTVKMIELDVDVIPQDICLKIQQGYFKTANFPLESVKLTTKFHRSANSKIDHERYASELELKFATECQGDAGEVVVKLEISWLYSRRPLFLGVLDPLQDPHFEVETRLHQHTSVRHSG